MNKSVALHGASLVTFSQRAAGPSAVANELRFATWDDFLASGARATGFFLEDCTPDLQDELLWQIRQSRWWEFWVALGPKAPSSSAETLADARQSRDKAAQSAAMVQAARTGLPHGAHLDFEERLLQFLFVRDGASLQPVPDRHSHYLYRFPLAEALGADEERVTRVLLDLQRRRFLEPGVLIDRVRHCRKCSSAHPHYHDVCPHCRSIQIEKSAALHCFTCGHVAPQADYVQDSKLVCPQCNAHLRHIGVDYDRPLTQYACADCHHAFVEASVQVRCLDCGELAEPDALDVRGIAPLRLTARGRAAMREGSSVEHAVASEFSQHVPQTAFSQALGWTLRPSGDAPNASLVAMELTVQQQDARGLALIDEGVRRMHELLVDSDISTVDADERLWFLVGDGASLIHRVRAMYPSGSDAQLRTAFIDLSDVGEARDPRQLMSRLKSELM
ncbi:TackOD1 domain-containing metal-binding protein [Diaphorobacter aerolatus]|uniref:Thaumarchaeal output domain-containing protein n=1 Tax=Diaphorobacter aerolatus TaxID=1288495 RepID=A0A7H0GL84_9BURK|nr:hypothetical protein [Diaphorobacter aerolatus]QNP49050.1 hypothetical protein H9K75_02520 [Diaphorobacter aerolatus]